MAAVSIRRWNTKELLWRKEPKVPGKGLFHHPRILLCRRRPFQSHRRKQQLTRSSHQAARRTGSTRESDGNFGGMARSRRGLPTLYLLSHDSILLDGAVTVVGITQRLDCCARDRQHRELHQTLLRACTSVPTGCRSERLFLGHYTVMWRDRVWEIRTCSGKLAHAGDADQDQLFPIISANVNHDSDILSAMLYTDQPE